MAKRSRDETPVEFYTRTFVDQKYRDLIFSKLLTKLENRVCFDCNAKNPSHVLVQFGIFICLDCSKIHAQCTWTVAYAKPTNAKLWRMIELRMIVHGGNYSANIFSEEYGWTHHGSTNTEAKYKSDEAKFYKRYIITEASICSQEGRDLIKECDNHLSKHMKETDLAGKAKLLHSFQEMGGAKLMSKRNRDAKLPEYEPELSGVDLKCRDNILSKLVTKPSNKMEETDLARRRFPDAKSISSSQFHKELKNKDHDYRDDMKAKLLHSFRDSTSISSDDLFDSGVNNRPTRSIPDLIKSMLRSVNVHKLRWVA